MITVEIPGRPPSTNDSNRQVPAERWRHRREWRETAAEYAIAAKVEYRRERRQEWETLKVAHVVITFFLPDLRRRDWDNLVSSCKPLFDGIVDAGILADDSTGCVVTVSTTIELRPKLPGTRFDIRKAL